MRRSLCLCDVWKCLPATQLSRRPTIDPPPMRYDDAATRRPRGHRVGPPAARATSIQNVSGLLQGLLSGALIA